MAAASCGHVGEAVGGGLFVGGTTRLASSLRREFGGGGSVPKHQGGGRGMGVLGDGMWVWRASYLFFWGGLAVVCAIV